MTIFLINPRSRHNASEKIDPPSAMTNTVARLIFGPRFKPIQLTGWNGYEACQAPMIPVFVELTAGVQLSTAFLAF